MLGFLKMSALSAVLSFGVVTAYNGAVSAGPTLPSQKAFNDRVLPEGDIAATGSVRIRVGSEASRPELAGRKGDRLLAVVPTDCDNQEWPYLAADCLSRDDGRAKPTHVRVITIERREGANTSVLQRVSQSVVAQR
jgi:hypothetical protein